jgi:hypothetical protein
MTTPFAEDVVPVSTRAMRIENAKHFLKENPTETIACAARIHDLTETTLYSSISREKKEKDEAEKTSVSRRGGHNKILSQDETDAVHDLIRSLLICDIPPTHNLILRAISFLKRAKESGAPSRRWFQKWWKNSGLHRIKTKPIAVIRYSAAQESDVQRWFVNYRNILQELNILRPRNVWNFDEAGFRVDCMQKGDILVPADICEFYSISPENRKSLTIIECINAAGHKPIPPVLIIQGQRLMQNWVQPGLPAGTLIKTSENGFTSDQIAIDWLKHFIDHTNSDSLSEWKLLLMDQHGSHCTPEFVRLANDHHIRPFPFIPHLTHCMQPLNVGIFTPTKNIMTMPSKKH